jgi:hypothetical protein
VSDELAALAAEAYIYGFPLIFDLQSAGGVVREGMGLIAPAPFNSFSHASKLAGPDDRFVSINNDTIYSIAPRQDRFPSRPTRLYSQGDGVTRCLSANASPRPAPPQPSERAR